MKQSISVCQLFMQILHGSSKVGCGSITGYDCAYILVKREIAIPNTKINCLVFAFLKMRCLFFTFCV